MALTCAGSTSKLGERRQKRVYRNRRASVLLDTQRLNTTNRARSPARTNKSRTHTTKCASKNDNLKTARATETATEDILAEPELSTSTAEEQLTEHKDLRRGKLSNGLNYVIFPNQVPPRRFEAHLEMHVGSIDEEPHELGVAHLVEHITFLGSRKRELLLGTGAKSNAYTDLHHTVFHVNSPEVMGEAKEDMLPIVLDTLDDVAFNPLFLPNRIEKERKAVLAEAGMMNTMEYRVDCKLLERLHLENNLGVQFPIGISDQIESWSHDVPKRFYERWYFPANATLYVVGDLTRSVDEVEKEIERAFGEEPVAIDQATQQPKAKHRTRPPVTHKYGTPTETEAEEAWQPGERADEVDVHLYRHNLLQQFSINFFCKLPVRPIDTKSELELAFLSRLVTSALHFRISSRCGDEGGQSMSVELDHSDSGREGCVVTVVTMTCEPDFWHSATRIAVEEARRLARHGVTETELERYKHSLILDSQQLAEQSESVPSSDTLDFVMESDSLGHKIMDQRASHEVVEEIGGNSLNLHKANFMAMRLFGFISEYGRGSERDERASVATAIVACAPDEEDTITEDALREAICDSGDDISAAVDVSVPDRLVGTNEVEREVERFQPNFRKREFDSKSQVHMRELQNNIKVACKVTNNEPKSANVKLTMEGGRCAEAKSEGVEGGYSAKVLVGVRALSEAVAVGEYSRQQMELFCMSNLVEMHLDAEFDLCKAEIRLACHKSEGIRPSLEILHLLLNDPVFNEEALKRAKTQLLSQTRGLPKSLERYGEHKAISSLLGNDGRVLDPSEEAIESVTLQEAKEAIQAQMNGNLEVNIVGDVDVQQLDTQLLALLGTVDVAGEPSYSQSGGREEGGMAKRTMAGVTPPRPTKQGEGSEMRKEKFKLVDSDRRAAAWIAGPSPAKWEKTWKSKLPQGIVISLLQEIVSSRLFTTVRDSLGLTYDVTFSTTSSNFFNEFSFFTLNVITTPERVEDALDACIHVLRDIKLRKVNQREVDRAKRTLLTRNESESKDNKQAADSLDLLNSDNVPLKDFHYLGSLNHMYESATADDVDELCQQIDLSDEAIASVVGETGPAE